MKSVIFAGGLGTRLSEETTLKPKPMLTIGNDPILLHIMKIYSHYSIRDFVICCGYKSEIIKDYFYDLCINTGNVCEQNSDTFKISFNSKVSWNVELVDTGLDTQTGGRLLRVKDYIGDQFCLTYGDGLSNINLKDLIEFHSSHNKKITVTGVNPKSKYGALNIGSNNIVTSFQQKPILKNHIVNAGFFVCDKSILKYISSDKDEFEVSVLEKVAQEGELVLYKHDGFWECMDTQRDKIYLNELWEKNQAKWKVWKD